MILTFQLTADEDIGVAGTLGIRLKIHEQDEEPYPQDDGLNLDAGFSYSVAMTAVRDNEST